MISPKKQRFVDYIKSFTHLNNRPPTFVEIMNGLNINSLGTINWYVNELEKDGAIARIKGKNGKRALSVLESHISNSLPLLGLISAGKPLEQFDITDRISVPQKYIKPGNFALRVNGDSMEDDGILHNDIIIAKKADKANNGETVIAQINNEATLKKLYIRNNKIELHPRNEKYNIININDEDEFIISGILIGLIRNYDN